MTIYTSGDPDLITEPVHGTGALGGATSWTKDFKIKAAPKERPQHCSAPTNRFQPMYRGGFCDATSAAAMGCAGNCSTVAV
jgi:hypothetical protein